jgi:hypothetical protein
MIDTQLIDGVLVALAALAGVAIVFSVVMLAAASVSRPGPAPHGGTRRDLPQHPQPDSGDDRVLVLR